MENEKKSIFELLVGKKKTQKPSCCCNIELEEVTENNENDKNVEAPREEDGN